METHVINAMKNEISDNSEFIFINNSKSIRSKFLAIIKMEKKYQFQNSIEK